jgi:hypothetical protein
MGGMNTRKDKGRLPPFVPLDKEMMDSPAWRAMSYGARCLYIHLKRRNNGRIFLSERDAQEEMGCTHRDSIRRWFRENQHYGFIVMTEPGCLGVDGKGKAPHWRLTEAECSGGRNGNTWMLPTKDYLKWDGTKFRDDQKQNPGPESGARVAPEAMPGLAPKAGPVRLPTGPGSGAISGTKPGPESGAISRQPLGWPVGGTSACEGGERSAPVGSAVASEPPDWQAEGYSPGSPPRDDVLATLERQAQERWRARKASSGRRAGPLGSAAPSSE